MGEAVHDRLKIPSILWATLKRLGVDRSDVVRRAALPVNVIRNDAAVSTEQFFRVWRAIEAASADDTIGLRIATTIETGVMQVGFNCGVPRPRFSVHIHGVNPVMSR